jgi:hypothetical protein
MGIIGIFADRIKPAWISGTVPILIIIKDHIPGNDIQERQRVSKQIHPLEGMCI